MTLRAWIPCVLVLAGCTTELADLRPPERVVDDPARRAAGAAILARSLEAHGSPQRWAQVQRVTGTVRDDWHGVLLQALFREWEEDDQPGAFEVEPQRWGSLRVRWVEGDNAGDVWALGGGVTTREFADGSREVDDAEWLRLSLETLEYLVGLPFRLATADQVVFLREDRGPGGALCDVLLLSWGTLEPQPDVDQWELWIERESGLLVRTRYTARDFAPDATAVYDYLEPLAVGGFVVPQTIEGRLALDDEPFHTYRYSDWAIEPALDPGG